MKNHLKKFVFAFLMAYIGTVVVNAQEGKLSHVATLGINFPILDEGLGYHLGYNPDISLTKNFGIQGQLSYSFTDITSTFLSGNTGSYKSINLLVGPRIYLRDSTSNLRPYLCALAGVDRFVETRSGVKREPGLLFGLSVGLYAEIKKFIVGFCAESPSILVLKAGYIF